MAHNDAYAYTGQPQFVQRQHLTVTEIERLAKAGVSMTLCEIIPQSDPYTPPDPPPHNGRDLGMEQAIWERYVRSKRAAAHGRIDEPAHFGMIQPFKLLATQHGDKVVVSVHPTNFAYEPFTIEDVAVIFPSDALMAKIALWEKEHPSA